MEFFQQLHLESSLKIGLVVVLHTFGKDMKFNPHLHIITNLNENLDKKFNKIWRRIVLSSFNIKSSRYYYGYYVNSGRKTIYQKQIAKYTGRYVRHPAIANGRIIHYNKNKITFFYKDNQNNKITVTKSINNFITSLIQHIPPKQFKIVRYYGTYCRNKRKY
tara:strand:+ start:218 stop:703 length:486 start_codon:yes stop_codon:yes gene_type:complete